MATYYAVCNVNGPISVRLEAADDKAAVAEFTRANTRAWIDAGRTDAEDDLLIDDAAEMGEGNFADALREAGCEEIRDLAEVCNAHAGTIAHMRNGWMLWRKS